MVHVGSRRSVHVLFFCLEDVTDLLPTVSLIFSWEIGQIQGPMFIYGWCSGYNCRLTTRRSLVWIHWRPEVFLCGVCMFSLWLRGFSQGPLASSHSLTACVRGIGDSTLTSDVNVSVKWLFVSVCYPGTGWWLVWCLPRSWDRLQPPLPPSKGIKQ